MTVNICVSALQLKRRKERLDKQLVAFKMSVHESLIKQTFNTDFEHTNTVFVGFKKVETYLLLHVPYQKRKLGKYMFKQMEPEVNKLLLITYTGSFPIIKSLIRLEISAAGTQSAAQKVEKKKTTK